MNDEEQDTDATPAGGLAVQAGQEPEKDGVKLSEEFQQQTHDLVNGATSDELDYIMDCCNKRSEEVNKTEELEKEFSSDDEPQDSY